MLIEKCIFSFRDLTEAQSGPFFLDMLIIHRLFFHNKLIVSESLYGDIIIKGGIV